MYKKILFFLCFSQLAWASFSQNLPPGAASYANEGNEPLEFRTGMPNTKGSSPNVSAFRRIEDAGVDMFNGISTLKLPLYRLSGEQMQFDVGLSYYGGGVRMNEIAGWTGLSWTLDGEYQISRIVNDLPDEWYNTASSSYMSGAYRDKGYLYTAKQQLDHNNWTSPGFLGLESFDIHLLSNVATMDKFIFDSEPDEFRFALPNGVSGSFYRDHRANPNDLNGWKVKSKSNLVLEITHELHVVEYNTNNLYEIELDKWSGGSTCKIPTLFTKFIIGTPDGYRYVFGGVETALEVSRGILKFPNPSDPKIKTEAQYTVNSWKLSKIIAPSGEEVNFAYSRDKIQFQRSKELINAVKQGTNQWSTPSLEVNASITYPVYLSVIETKKQKLIFKRSQAIEKWYLALVDSGCNMSTLGPSANNNNFSFLVLRDDQQHCQYAYNYLWDSQNNFEGNLPNYNQQLDSVILFDKLSNQYVDGFKLVQRANPNHRRTLDRIFKFNFTDSKIQDNYEFTYNNIEGLPNLEAWNRDYWGFEQDGNAEPVTGCGILYELRSTTGNFAIKGLLNTIKNPLGGITEIQYEANVYSKQIKVNTTNGSVNVANNVNGNAVGPGARVKKIIQKDYLGAPDTYKEYFYTSNYPVGTNSSGLLNFDNIAIDAITGNCGNSSSTLANYSTLNQNQFTKQFKGGIINYSEVTERNADGSYTVFNYTNAENPEYRDEFAAGYGSYNVLNSSNLNFRLSSKDLDRGKMKTIRQYSSNNRLVKKTENIYQDDPLRVSDYIKSISILTLGSISSYYCLGQAEPGLGNHRAWAYKNYTYKNPLIKSIQTDYFESGPDIVSETEYGYDPYGNIASTKSKDSDGNTIVKTTKYNSHPDYDMVTSNNTASGIRKLKYQYGIKNFPVETMFSSQKPPVSGVDQPPYYLSAQLNTVNINRPMPEKKYLLRAANGLIEGTPSNTNGFFSSKISTSGTFQMDSRYVLEEEIIDFTTGNALALPKPVSVTNRQGGNYTLTWDHSGFYASSKTANVTVAEIAYSGFDGTYSGNNAVFKNGWNFNEANVQTGISFTGQRSLQAVPVSSGTAANAFITTGNVIIGKPYKISFWARSVIGNLYLANGTSATVLSLKKTGKDGWQYYEAEFIPNGTVGLVYASSGIIPINAQIDELMLLPMNAQMESYSYNTGTGNITSVNTGNGNVLLYEYDGLGRLLTVRDDAGNILKNHSYKLQNN